MPTWNHDSKLKEIKLCFIIWFSVILWTIPNVKYVWRCEEFSFLKYRYDCSEIKPYPLYTSERKKTINWKKTNIQNTF